MTLSIEDFIVRLMIAVLCGGIIGLERQWINRTAGMQTNMLVCMGACLFVLGSFMVGHDANSSSRIAAQVVSGIGFLGGGMIFKDGFTAHGINTAATIWCAAAIGVLCALGFEWGALGATILIILANTFFRKIDTIIFTRRRPMDARITQSYSISILLPQATYSNAVKQQIIDLVSKDSLNKILSVKTGLAKKDMYSLDIVFLTRNLEFKWANDIVKEIENMNETLIVDWSLVNKN